MQSIKKLVDIGPDKDYNCCNNIKDNIKKNIIKINLGITHWKCQKLNQKKENNENFILCHSGTNIYYGFIENHIITN